MQYLKSDQLKSVKKKKTKTFIRKKSIKNKNNVAKFSEETKREIVERDKSCISCWDPWTDCHHIYFSQQAEYWEDKNNANKWVLLCRLCHWKVHSCKSGEWVRQECIDYFKT